HPQRWAARSTSTPDTGYRTRRASVFSTRETRRRTTRGMGEETTLLALALTLVLAGLAAWAALSIGNAAAGRPVTTNPATALAEIVFGQRSWPWQATIPAAVFTTVGVTAAVLARRIWAGGSEIDAAARTMQRPSDIRIARIQDNLAANQRLLRDADAHTQALPGPPLGRTVIGGMGLHVPAELGVTIAAGTRTGKTMAWAIPAVLAAWGPCLATSNKPDLYRHTVYGRRQR